MKALEILKHLHEHFPLYGSPEVNEAIAELEALQAPKTCESCVYSKCEADTPLHDLYCAGCSRIHVDYYEPKETL